MIKRFVLMCLAVVLLASPCFAEGDTSSTFILGIGSVLVAQNQDVEDITSTFQLDVVRLIPWIPWYVGGVVQYSRIHEPGEDEIDVNGRLIAFFSDPNGPELNGNWVGFLTLGGIELYDNDDAGDSRVARTNTDGSIGVIGPIAGMNLVVELGAKWRLNPLGEMETYWSFGIGFLGIPKSPLKF